MLTKLHNDTLHFSLPVHQHELPIPFHLLCSAHEHGHQMLQYLLSNGGYFQTLPTTSSAAAASTTIQNKIIFVWHYPLYAASHLLYHPTKKHINFAHSCGPNI